VILESKQLFHDLSMPRNEPDTIQEISNKQVFVSFIKSQSLYVVLDECPLCSLQHHLVKASPKLPHLHLGKQGKNPIF